MINLPKYVYPDFTKEQFVNAPDATLIKSELDGTVAENYHATTIYPTFVKINGTWILAKKSRMDCVLVVDNDDTTVRVVEFRNIKKGDKVVIGRKEDGQLGIYVDFNAFIEIPENSQEAFSFRQGRSRETAYSQDYDKLYDILRYDKENGYIVFVCGPAVVFDHDSRLAMQRLVENGYIDAILAGNAFATHDLEGSFFNTALGQDIYTKKSQIAGHYNHIDVLNRARKSGSISKLIEDYKLDSGVIVACEKNNVPYVLAGSIRDDGPLPCVIADVYEAQDKMRYHIQKATTVIALATQLHTIAAGNMTPCFQVLENGDIRPTFFYTVDISEFAVNKLRDRGSLSVNSIVTNVQDFMVNMTNNLLDK
ncbi:MAG: hypothetical protein WCR54_04595 [Clostridia bacterium]